MQAQLDIKELLRLQRELAIVKNQALSRFAEGKLGGRDLLSGFLSHVNDSRNYLNRLILHQRDNLEERATSERRPAAMIWQEVLGEATSAEPVLGQGEKGIDGQSRPVEPLSIEGGEGTGRDGSEVLPPGRPLF
jgi:hypothetical protein